MRTKGYRICKNMEKGMLVFRFSGSESFAERNRMSPRRRRRTGGRRPRKGRLARSEVATLRLDPKLRYFLELAARKQRRTISSYLEWAAEQSLDRIRLTDSGGSSSSLTDEVEQLWNVDKVARFVKLASRHSDLLNHHEQMLWKLIQQNQYVWPRYGDEQPLANLNIGRLGMHWDKFVAVADDKAGKSILPD
jgi:hypothetical protein